MPSVCCVRRPARYLHARKDKNSCQKMEQKAIARSGISTQVVSYVYLHWIYNTVLKYTVSVMMLCLVFHDCDVWNVLTRQTRVIYLLFITQRQAAADTLHMCHLRTCQLHWTCCVYFYQVGFSLERVTYRYITTLSSYPDWTAWSGWYTNYQSWTRHAKQAVQTYSEGSVTSKPQYKPV
jgi:hypothetical protein